MIRHIMAPAAALALVGCTNFERLNINTVAVNCNITRGDDKAVTGDAQADVLAQQGQAAAQFVGSLRSIIRCTDGTEVVADVDGTDQEQ